MSPYWVEVSEDRTHSIKNGMSSHSDEFCDWLKAHIAVRHQPLAVISPNRTCRYYFLEKSEAVLFKLTWA